MNNNNDNDNIDNLIPIKIKIGKLENKVKNIERILEHFPIENILTENIVTIVLLDDFVSGSVYISSFLNQNITLPDTSNVKHPLFKITIIANGGDKIINLFSDFSTDVVIYNMVCYSNSSSDIFTLLNSGYVELLHTSGGWYVTSSCGFSLNI